MAVLENNLKAIDESCQRSTAPVHNGSFRQDAQQERKKVLRETKEKLSEYSKAHKPRQLSCVLRYTKVATDDYIIAYSELKSRPRATARQQANLENWHYKNQGAILPQETEYIKKRADLITITPIIKTPLLRALECTRWFSTASIFRRRPIELLPSAYDENTMYYHSDTRLQTFDTMVVMMGGLTMLLAPIWILDAVDSGFGRLGVISTFIILFVALVQAVTTAKSYETLAAAAAYSAVLMVFVQTTSKP